MHVAIVIVGFRNADDIGKCLTAIAATTYADFEVVICENGGRAAYEALGSVVPSRLPGGQPVKAVAAPRNLGYAGGVNHGIDQASDADAWWVLNPDTEPEPAALGACVARLAAGDCEAVGTVLYLPDDRIQCYGGRWQPLLGRALALGQGARLSDPVDAARIERTQSYLSGASMLIGRRFREVVGPMREDYFLYCEEVEWCLRGRSLGMRLAFAPGARVLHHAGATTGSRRAFRQMPKTPVYLNERNRILLTRDLWPRRVPLVALTAFGVVLLRFARRGAWRQVGYALEGWLAGLRDRRGPPSWIAPNPS